MSYELIVRGGRVLDPSQGIDGVMDIAFADGKVAALGRDLEAGRAPMVRDATGLSGGDPIHVTVARGTVDARVERARANGTEELLA